ncbi:MAG: PSD1 domain-containing protein [Verrucomicrobia bacterium]|nr:PSD1 domain-containing protein [Verrucomicrobiota bacterium]
MPLLAVCPFLLLHAGSPFTVSASELTFEQHVRPILKAHCFDCHGEGEKLKGDLDLRLRRLIVKGGESGPALVPGHPEKSELVEKIRSGEMPKRDKKLSSEEISTIEKWITGGAKTARDEPAEIGQGMLITEEDRAHWAFQPVRRPAIPAFKNSDRVRTPVDAFLLAELRKRQLSFSPDADRITLIRRAHLDLLGLPPSPEDVAAFVEDKSQDAYEKLIDRLLSSPRYGERWGRHWLDAAGYADSDGYTEADTPREYAYKYRDYVIQSFNTDKPFNEFIVEQLAGDELAAEVYTNLPTAIRNPAALEKLTATGFLRMGSDGTATFGIDQDTARNQVIADTIKIVSTSLLGLSVGCAQCHDHRYDPIPQTDYYRLRAVLEPAYDWKKWRTPQQRLLSLYTDADRARAAEVESEARKLAAEKDEKQKKYIAEALEKHLEKFETALRDPLRAAYQTPPDKRTAEQKKLLMDHPSVNITPGVLYQYNPKAADDLKAMDAKIAEVRARKPPEDFIQTLTEVPGQIPVTYVFHRGDPKQPKEAVQPGGLSIFAPPRQYVSFPEKDSRGPSAGRRLAFARWLTSGDQPLVARVLVNRVWMHHFGRGIVGTPADFGMLGEKPTHPELLDWLASVFTSQLSTPNSQLALRWSLKRLHKLIMTSTAYRQSSRRDPEKEPRDPDNQLYWRKPAQRLDAESIRDSILAASGALNLKMSGPPVPVREDLVGQVVVGVDKKQGDNKMPVDVPMGGEEFRRSVYVQVRRSKPLAFLNSFDAPVMEVNCERRQSSTVATQALMLMNSDFILDQAQQFVARLRREAGPNPRDQIARAWQLAFSRGPTESEMRRSLEFLGQQMAHLTNASEKASAESSEKASDKKAKPEGSLKKTEPSQQALTNLCQALLSANEFLYVD